MQPRDIPEVQIRIAGVQQFHCRQDTIKDLCPFQSYIDDCIGQDVM